jgi:DNA-binding NarL/FixJ family response regulator
MTKPTCERTRVALVEDDAETRQRLAASICEHDWLELVEIFATGTEALSALVAANPDVLLVDLGLPDISGLEIIRFAAARLPDCDVLVISMFGDEANVLAALEAGARGYLLKGSLARDISIDIRDLRDGGSPLSPSIARQVLKRLQSYQPGRAKGKGSEDIGLSPREIEILNAISRGFSYAETSVTLGITVGTVHTHLKRIYGKLAVHSKTEAVYEAGRLGLLP